MEYDFCGWATKNDLKCADGRVIRKNAFKGNDGKTVPLVWNHQHGSAENVLGHAMLKNKNDGVYAYCKFNATNAGKHAKEMVKHGDVTNLSILANNLVQDGPDVKHGVIREVSLVLAGANPGAFVESVMMHGEPMDIDEEEGIFYTDESISSYLQHAEDGEDSDDDDDEEEEDEMKGKTIAQIIDGMTEEQKQAMAVVIGQAVEDAKGGGEDEEDEEDEEEDEEVRHSIFDEDDVNESGYLTHADFVEIMTNAKRVGTFKEALRDFCEDRGVLMHGINIDTTGMTTATGNQQYAFNDPDMLFPEYKSVNGGAPEWLSRNMDWVNVVMNGVHHTPFSRVKTTYADITEDDARARGYLKGNMKKEEFFTIMKRTTDPQTIYKKQKIDRDDMLDITDFDVIMWLKAEMRLMLNEEIARAILIGDGRSTDSDDKIKEDHIRPIAKEQPLFNTVVEVAAGANEGETAKNTINAAIRARKNYKGSGNPMMFTTEDVVTEMLLLEDKNGHKLYKTIEELTTALRVSRIVTVEVMENQKVNEKELIGIIVNLSDYNVGADKGGDINTFEQFDIDYNQQKYLIETRISGALIKPFSAITLVKGGTASASYMSKSSKSNA